MDLQDPTLNGRPPIDKKGNLALALGFSLLVLLAVSLLVTLIVTLDGRTTPAPAGGLTSPAQQTVEPEDDATYGLDADKRMLAQAKPLPSVEDEARAMTAVGPNQVWEGPVQGARR
ncbi:hypothetical protein [Burkholderia anthina]|uniref:hypothetical protein n=1 Tax=Burkholderia anthina TaxID=179879 RepID=UPI0037C025DF